MATERPAHEGYDDRRWCAFLSREILAGVFLLGSAAVGYYAAFPLEAGVMSGVGSGLLPKAVALLLGAFCAYLVILGAILAFAATVRPFGLLVAGPLSMLLSAMADPDTRPMEIIVFTACMTVGCYLLFKVVLSLPIPVLPPLLGY
jgi:hypothetical protein